MLRARSRTRWLSLLFAGVTTVNAALADSHPFSVQDLVAMDRIVGSQLSPDGRRIAYVVSRLDLDNNRRLNDLYLVGSDGSAARQLTVGNGTDSEPRWAPDNRTLYFLSARSGSSQVWRIRIDGGEAGNSLVGKAACATRTADGTNGFKLMQDIHGMTP